MNAFYEYVRHVWLGALPQQLIRAILVAALFELLLVLIRRYILARLRPILLRDAGDPPALRVQRRRLLLMVPIFLSRALMYVLALLIILRIFGLQTWAELLPLVLATVGVTLVAFYQPLRDAAQGYLLLYDHLYTRGDHVLIAGREGIVQEVGLRWTHLHAMDGTEILVPHSAVREVVNYSRGKRPAAEEAPSGPAT
jgi:moderate conductance mechanosensitive channel